MDGYEWTVYTTWQLSFERLRTHSAPAATFLQHCAFLHYDGIFQEIFQKAAVVIEWSFPDHEPDSVSDAKDFLGLFITSGAWDTRKFLNIISEIRSYSLIDFDDKANLYSIHPLVHDWIRATMSYGDATRASAQCMLGMSVIWNLGSESYSFRRALLPHIDAALQGGIATGSHLTASLGYIYHEGGRWKEAAKLEALVMETRKQVLGEEHPDLLGSMGNLAISYGKQGRWKEAEELEELVMEKMKRVLGEEHPHSLMSMSNLASTYSKQGRWKEAEELGVQVMETRKRLLGEEHPDSLMSMGNLASTYWDQGRWKEAEELEVEVMETRKRVLGEEHPDSLRSMANLASTYWNQGRLKEAEELDVLMMETRKRVLGEEHPHSLTAMNNLALTYCEQGRWKEAEELEVDRKSVV